MGRLRDGQAALVSRMQATATSGEAVTYTRKVGGTVDLTGKAWVGRTVFSRTGQDVGAAAVVYGDRDYLIPVADLALSGTAFEPARGDRITETVNGAALVFEIVTPAGEPEWRHSDQTKTVFRVHTKQQRAT